MGAKFYEAEMKMPIIIKPSPYLQLHKAAETSVSCIGYL